MRTNAPCKGCPDRQLGCHSTCEKFKEFQHDWEKLKENKNLTLEYAKYRGTKMKHKNFC